MAFALWTAVPFVAAMRAHTAAPARRGVSALLGVSTLATDDRGGRMARRPSASGSGTAQRAMLVSAFAWYPLAMLAVDAAGSARR